MQLSWIKALDESMSAWQLQMSKNGGLPNISYIARKPEPLGAEFKSVFYPATDEMVRLEIEKGKAMFILFLLH